MNILYVVTQGEVGGAQKYVLQLAQAFHGRIAMGTESDRLAMEAENAGIAVSRLYHLKRGISPLNDILALYDLVHLVKKTRPDIVHLNSSKAGFLGSLLPWFIDVKIIYTAHGFVFNEPKNPITKWFLKWLERFSSRFRDYIIAVSQYDMQTALEAKIIDPGKISVVHNGIDEFILLNKTSARQYLGLSTEKAVVGTIANPYHNKGLDVLIKAASLLPLEQRDFLQIGIIGEGKMRHLLERQIAKLGLQNVVKLLGHRELANHYLRAFDVFTLPSRKEGFPYALLEAMQAGLPIIATEVGGNSEALGGAGILIPPNNPKQLANTISTLIFGTAPDGGITKLEELSKKSLLRARELTPENMISETNKIYEMIIMKPD